MYIDNSVNDMSAIPSVIGTSAIVKKVDDKSKITGSKSLGKSLEVINR